MKDTTLETDTHWRAEGGKGSFNYRLLFKLELPFSPKELVKPCHLTLTAWDRDPLLMSKEMIGSTRIDLSADKNKKRNVFGELKGCLRIHDLSQPHKPPRPWPLEVSRLKKRSV
eukprot:SAG31_NODE_4670_length_3046_cov_1.967424_6_plen_113_part_01